MGPAGAQRRRPGPLLRRTGWYASRHIVITAIDRVTGALERPGLERSQSPADPALLSLFIAQISSSAGASRGQLSENVSESRQALAQLVEICLGNNQDIHGDAGANRGVSGSIGKQRHFPEVLSGT